MGAARFWASEMLEVGIMCAQEASNAPSSQLRQGTVSNGTSSTCANANHSISSEI